MGAGDAAVYETSIGSAVGPETSRRSVVAPEVLVKLQNARWAEMRAARVPRGTRRSKVLLSTILDKRCPY